jgi:uncharacterized protein DUF1571
MTNFPLARRDFLRTVAATGASCLAAGACAAEPNAAEGLREPVHRVAKANNETVPAAAPADGHPLDPALKLAGEALTLIRTQIEDYTCRIIKRERVKGELGQIEHMDAKIRNRKIENGKLTTPLSVYLSFVGPENVKGREVVWVEGQNNGKLRAHEGGIKGRFLPSVWLDPDGPLAMNGQLHPIYDIGLENLVVKLIERGEKEKQFGECEVTFTPGAKINGRVCTLLQVMHPVKRPHFEFHLAQIFIDDVLKVPVRYAAYFWPEKAGSKDMPILEEYTYLNVKLNVGLKDADFDSENPNYNF